MSWFRVAVGSTLVFVLGPVGFICYPACFLHFVSRRSYDSCLFSCQCSHGSISTLLSSKFLPSPFPPFPCTPFRLLLSPLLPTFLPRKSIGLSAPSVMGHVAGGLHWLVCAGSSRFHLLLCLFSPLCVEKVLRFLSIPLSVQSWGHIHLLVG